MPHPYQRARKYVLAALGIDRHPRTTRALFDEAEGRHSLELIQEALTIAAAQGLAVGETVDGVVLWALTDEGLARADQARSRAERRRARRLARERTATTWAR